MKRIPMILVLVASGATLAICYLADLDLTPGLFVCGAILILNMVYAFLLPRLGFKVKQILSSYPILTPLEKNQLWKLVMKKATVYRSQEDELTIRIHPNLPK